MSMTLPEINNKETIIPIENLPVINLQKDFDDILKVNNIKDPINQTDRIGYKAVGSQYVFSIDGKNTFVVPNYYSLIAYLKIFYEQQQTDEKAVYISEASEAGGLLKLKVTINKDQATKNLSEKQTNELLDAANLKTALNRTSTLITFFGDQQDLSSDKSKWRKNFSKNTKIERVAWKRNGNEAGNVLELLNNIQESLTNIENNKYTGGQNPDEIRQTIAQHSALLTDLERVKSDFRSQAGDITEQHIDSVPYYPVSTNTPNQARDLRNMLNKQNKQFALLNKYEISAAKKILLAQDLERLDEYLDEIEKNPDKTNIKPFIPIHSADFALLVNLDPKLKAFFIDNKTNTGGGNTGTGVEGGNNTGTEGNNIEGGNNTGTEGNEAKNNGPISSRKEALDQKGFNGAIRYGLDQTNMTPEQKNFWGGTANLAMIGGLAFMGFKFIQNTFRLFTEDGRKKLKAGQWGWIAGPLLAVGVSQGFTGESPWSLLNGGKLSGMLAGLFSGNLFGGNKEKQGNNTQQSIEQQQYVEGLNGAMALFNGQTYQQIKDKLDYSDGVMKLKPDYYDIWKAELEKGDEKQKLAGKFLADIGKDDPNNMIDLALTGMGITWDKLSNNPTDTFNDRAGEVILRLGELHGYLEASNKNINPEMLPLVKKYLQENKPTLDELKARYDVFEDSMNLDDATKNAIDTKIDALNLTDPKQKKGFTEAFYRFYQNFPAEADTKRYIDIIRNGNDISLRTYHYETKIDLDNKTIPGLTNSSGFPMQFESYQELLNVANLTNRIKYLTKDLEAKGINPFSINTFGNIEFDNTKRSNLTDIDKRILTEEGLKKISQRLGTTEKESYVKYLNNLGTWKPEVSSQNWIEKIPPLLGIVSQTNETLTPDAEIRDYPDKLATSYTTIEKLPNPPFDENEKKLVKKALNMFYAEFPNINLQKVELSGSGPIVTFETYGKKTEINLTDKKLQGLSVSGFNGYFELFKAANLTNRLRDLFKDNNSQTLLEPFQTKLNDITFNDAAVLSMDADTRAISAGFFGSLKKISPKLAENKDLYSEYLNNLWLMEDKANGFFNIEKSNLPFDTKQEVIKGFKEFYKYFPESNKAVKLLSSGTKTSFETYQGNTEINLTDKTIVGLDITFEDHTELFKAANLVNRIKQITRNKTAGTKTPFNKSIPGGDIEFDVNDKFRDKEMITGGPLGNLDNISPKLEESKPLFLKYLDARRADKLAGRTY